MDGRDGVVCYREVGEYADRPSRRRRVQVSGRSELGQEIAPQTSTGRTLSRCRFVRRAEDRRAEGEPVYQRPERNAVRSGTHVRCRRNGSTQNEYLPAALSGTGESYTWSTGRSERRRGPNISASTSAAVTASAANGRTIDASWTLQRTMSEIREPECRSPCDPPGDVLRITQTRTRSDGARRRSTCLGSRPTRPGETKKEMRRPESFLKITLDF